MLELGGSDPFIVLGTDDLDSVVESAVAARLENTGQACNAAKRFIVIDDLYEPFLEKFTAALTAVKPEDPFSEEATIGPLSSSLATERLADQVDRAVKAGAKIVAGGEREGNFYPATVLTDIGPDNPAYREELFGPVASVYRVGSEEEAVKLANDTPFGLGSYVMTNDSTQALRVANNLDTGMVFVNVVGADGAELPFGGVKRSGFGRELGRFGADEFVNKKLIRVGLKDSRDARSARAAGTLRPRISRRWARRSRRGSEPPFQRPPSRTNTPVRRMSRCAPSSLMNLPVVSIQATSPAICTFTLSCSARTWLPPADKASLTMSTN